MEGKKDVFHQFEDLAIPILNDYNGELVYRLRPDQNAFVSHTEEVPYEIHLVSCESEEDFSQFTKDKRRL